MIKSLFTSPKLKQDAPEEPKPEKKTEQKSVQNNSNEPEDRMDDILRVVRERFVV